MSCEAMKKLPVIDLSNLKQATPTWESVKSQVREALEEYGCFEATLHDQQVSFQSLFNGLPQLFDLPSGNKLRNTSDIPFHGYVHFPIDNVPLYESLGIDDAASPGKIETFTNQMWSQGNPTFSKSVQSVADKLSELDKMVRTMVVESLGLSKYMNEHLDSTSYLFRVQKYVVPETQETKEALGNHRDKSFVTILCENEVNGLELLTKDGRWITLHPSPNSFIVMAGDSLHVWTNGRVHSPHHRVMMRGDKERYSIALFSYPKADYVMKTPEETVDEQHPLLFKPFNYSDYSAFFFSVLHQTCQDPLKTYCGL